MANTAKAICYDKDKIQVSSNYDSTFEQAVKIAESDKQHKIQIIDDTITRVADGLDYWLRLGVCYGLTFNQLKSKGMPCEDKKYYKIRREYYYLLSLRI